MPRSRGRSSLGPVRSSQERHATATKGQGKNDKRSLRDDENTMPWYCQGCDESIDLEDFDSIECAICKEWCHKRCSNLDREEFRVAQKGNSLLLYQCMKCRKSKKSPDEEPSRMEVKIDKMFEMFSVFTKKMMKMEENSEELHQRVDRVEAKIESEVDKKVREIFEDEKEKERRRPNAILVNVPESSNPDIEQREVDDKEAVLKVLEEVMDEKVAPSEIENPIRLGERKIGKDSKPRVMKITIANELFRKKLFGKTKNFNAREGDPKKKIYVNPDRTPKEREAYNKLKAELKERQKVDPDLCIFRMQIVKKKKEEGANSNLQRKRRGSGAEGDSQFSRKKSRSGNENSQSVSLEEDRESSQESDME